MIVISWLQWLHLTSFLTWEVYFNFHFSIPLKKAVYTGICDDTFHMHIFLADCRKFAVASNLLPPVIHKIFCLPRKPFIKEVTKLKLWTPYAHFGSGADKHTLPPKKVCIWSVSVRFLDIDCPWDVGQRWTLAVPKWLICSCWKVWMTCVTSWKTLIWD